MIRRLTILALLLTATACADVPPPRHAEILQDGDFPNLADVPARPTVLSPAERDALQQQLQDDNKAAQDSTR